ncbi:DeoR family transcriptional regulator [Streptomyces sp. G2]|uniref:DeoR family transcriptional regulator n=1 Tax=Streptomyces sp. G2 TaxID=1684471 RepID=UPI0035A8A38A
MAGERHDHLLELLGHEGEFVAKDVAVRLKISEDTVRRGLRDLAGEGLCRRVYGGASRAVGGAGLPHPAGGGPGRQTRGRLRWPPDSYGPAASWPSAEAPRRWPSPTRSRRTWRAP